MYVRETLAADDFCLFLLLTHKTQKLASLSIKLSRVEFNSSSSGRQTYDRNIFLFFL